MAMSKENSGISFKSTKNNKGKLCVWTDHSSAVPFERAVQGIFIRPSVPPLKHDARAMDIDMC